MKSKDISRTWRPIPGYDGKYEASTEGDVCRMLKSGKRKMLTSYLKKSKKKGSDYYIVKLTDSEGKSKEMKTAKVVFETFRGKVPEGYCIYHKDGDPKENRLNNLAALTNSELAKRTGHMSKHKPVTKYEAFTNVTDIKYKRGVCSIKIKASGIILPVDTYRSARVAAKENNMSYQTVIDRCNNKVQKSLYAPDGYIYMWDDDHQYGEDRIRINVA